MCERPFYRDDISLPLEYTSVHVYAFIMKYKQLMLYKYRHVFKASTNRLDLRKESQNKMKHKDKWCYLVKCNAFRYGIRLGAIGIKSKLEQKKIKYCISSL